ncbi:MAG: response regulator, partial [Elusimicrobia bacterium]|nr:response regulator [Elusimicrobiota bacterium]
MEPAPIRALLIEDDPEDVLLLTYMMAQEDWPAFRFSLECAESLAGGLAVLARGGVEVVLLDLMLPDSRGLDTLRAVRARFPDVPVVVLTGLSDESMGLQAVLEGAQDYQVKGNIEARAFKRTVSYAVERQRLLARVRTLTENSADGVAVVDEGGVVRYSNPAARELFGGAEGGLPGERFPFPLQPGAKREVRMPGGDEERSAELRGSLVDWNGRAATLVTMRDITDLRRVARLRAEVHESRRMDKLKDELMSAVSHEMRNPLTIIKAAAINLKEALAPPLSEEQATMMDLQFKNIQRLQKILDNILDLSRLESGKASIRPRRVVPAQLVQETARGYQLVAAERGMRIEVDLPPDLPAVLADPELFFDVLGNLLGNAIRYAKSRIVVRARA